MDLIYVLVVLVIYLPGVTGVWMWCYYTDVEEGKNPGIYTIVALIWPGLALGWLVDRTWKRLQAASTK